MREKSVHRGHRVLYGDENTNDKLITNLREIKHILHLLYEGRGSQNRILVILLEEETMTQRRLTERLGIQPGSVSEVLAKMEKSGLITRTENLTDRRTIDITLTGQGELWAEKALEQRRTRHEEMFSFLTEEEKETLLALLEKVNADWQERYQGNEKHHKEHGGQ